jgi:tRNA-specific adenosine deaminase 1
MDILPDEIAKLVLDKFDSLEQKRKPLIRSDGVKEWVPLSGIVVESMCVPKLHIYEGADI